MGRWLRYAQGGDFHVDGTLVDSVAIHAKAWQRAFGEFGRDLSFDEIRRQIGKGGDQLLPVFLSTKEIEAKGAKIDGRRAEILKSEYLQEIEGFPGVRALFERLRSDGIRIALASSAKGEELETYKHRADIVALTEEETSSDDAERSKPHGDIFDAAMSRLGDVTPADVIVVGDTPYEAEAARRVSLRTIGVLCGGFFEDELRSAGCVAVYKDPADLLRRYREFLRDASS